MIKQFNNPKFYNQTIPNEIDIPHVPVGAIIKGAAKYFGNRVAFLYRKKELTYKELYNQALRVANGLKEIGIGKGDVVAIQMLNCTQYAISYYGIVLSGATYTPINPLLPKDEFLFQLQDSGAKVLITYEQLVNVWEGVMEHSKIEKIIVTGDVEISSLEQCVDTTSYGDGVVSFNQFINNNEAREFTIDVDVVEDVVHIAYTGGTTGKPKGVMITHKNLVSNVLQSGAWSSAALPQLDDDGALTVKVVEKEVDKYLQHYPTLPGTNIRLSPAPMYHGAGTMGGLAYGVLFGATSIIFDRFIPEEFLADLERYKVTELSGAPAMFNFLLMHPNIAKHDFSSVRTINSGAAPIAMETMKLLIKYFPNAVVTEGYGLTESTASAVQSVGFYDGLRTLGTVGLPIYNTEVKLMSVDEAGKEVTEVGQRGEVCIKGPQVMKGYLNNPEVTAETLINGWLHTGDIGIFDENGFLSIVDRKKDMLIYNGYNVYPRQIEEHLYEHPAVAAAIVVGIQDVNVGEKPKAFVVLRQGVSATEEEIMSFVNDKVVHYSRIRELEFIDQLPMTAAGKISKIQLVEREKTRLNQV
ncbi:AMP-binding protein [Lysinibacillus sp. CD3-6]|uniref:class I adenylate-forming enzyme family protein n=1 Tax=Lysinibacillus sp. CD3-6 TaxID=2892541 RepID=UPI001175979D|nr:AMP-binding protein [Lysinibacillus sp. CD3-6]UED80027.1 AMP-binding protein [Lysinibacillus sp. CD3-6]